jgi:hypothetical protein
MALSLGQSTGKEVALDSFGITDWIQFFRSLTGRNKFFSKWLERI